MESNVKYVSTINFLSTLVIYITTYYMVDNVLEYLKTL